MLEILKTKKKTGIKERKSAIKNANILYHLRRYMKCTYVFVFVAQAGVKCAALYSGAHALMRHAQIHFTFQQGAQRGECGLDGAAFPH